MNLIKSFNFKYLKENIKKSKGLILLLLIVVPLLTTLFTVLFINGDEQINLANELEISWVNMLGMYVVPVGISFALFGYVYKKSSVDLINSMPLNKQTIFVTNTIGGIILLTLMQLITIALLFVCGLVCSNLVIFSKMLIDIFIMMWVGYVFIFVITNLAMAVSGTFLTQLVITALILFLIPFITMNLKGYMNSSNYKIFTDAIENKYMYANVRGNFTVPIHELLNIFESNSNYSLASLLKTVVLGLIYLVLGVVLFNRRKMEDTEESFKDERVHLLVKALTIFPMIVFLNTIEPSNIVTIFIVTIISIYYFAYDFIVKRKVKLVVSVIALVITLCVSYGATVTLEKMEEKIFEPSRKINVDDIVEVSINLDYRLIYDYYGIDNYFIKDEEIVKFVIESLKNRVSIAYDTLQTASGSIEALPYDLKISYKTKNGKILRSNASMDTEEFYGLIELLSKDEKYVNIVKDEYIYNGKIGVQGNVLPQDLEEEVRLELKNTIEKMSLLEVYEKLIKYSSIYYSDVNLAYYNNHKLVNKSISLDTSDNISSIIMKYQNDLAYKYIDKATSNWGSFRIVGAFYSEEIKNLDNNGFYYDFSYTKDDIVKFIKENKDVECDPTKDFYQIYYYDYKIGFSNLFYTNKIEEIDEIIKKEYEHSNKLYEDTYIYETNNSYPESTEILYVE